ncbi:MAG: polyprenyl synthetase family protein [Bryobacterales bacterium]|nr:polyprenyl synthetase family protein [Bryobacterales bacterium]
MGIGRLGQALTAREIFALIQADLRQVEEQIAIESVAPVDTITSIGQYLQASGGKRLRPSLLLLTSKLTGGAGPSAIRLGAVVELIHTATLVHDDVIDGADTRRGRPSTNAQWGNHTSVLAGDWLYMQAFQIALRERSFRVLDVLIALTQGMVEGELLQLRRIGQIAVSEADYMELVDRKTAGLFAACARLGALCGAAAPEFEEKLAEYGWNLGMAFQLVDDVLDFTARETVLGKPVGNDLREGKVTLPMIYALETAAPADRAMVETILRERSYESVPFAAILDLVKRSGGLNRAMERAQTFSDKARESLGGLPDSPYQRALVAITELVTDRDH